MGSGMGALARAGTATRRWLLAVLLLGALSPAWAGESMASLLSLARENDADFRAAQAARDAGLQLREAARAQLLPSLALSYETGHSSVTRDYVAALPSLEYSTKIETVEWRLSQPVFDLSKWALWKEESGRAALAESNFVEESISLTLRLSRAVFDSLLAEDNLVLARAQYEAMFSQRNEAEKLRAAGVLTLTDVENTRTRELQSQAGVAEATYGVALRHRELARIIGSSVKPEPRRLDMQVTVPPDPDDIEAWLSAVDESNPKVVSRRIQLEIAGHALDRARAGHLPTLSLVASQAKSKNPSNVTVLEETRGVSLQLKVPLFEGGRVSALSERAAALRTQAQEELESTRREAHVKAAESFLGISNARAKILALEQALRAAELALTGVKAGRSVGLRTHTEVLDVQQQVFTVRRDLYKEKYNYLLAGIQLKALVGRLTDADIAAIDRLATQQAQ